MKNTILMIAMILGSVSAFAEVRWLVKNDHIGESVAKIRGFTIHNQTLQIKTEDTTYVIPNTVIQSAGFSIKEFMDLLKEYDASKTEALYFDARRSFEGSLTVDSIDGLSTLKK